MKWCDILGKSAQSAGKSEICRQNKKTPTIIRLSVSFVVFGEQCPLFQVEPEGVEPSSKQAAEMLSTSLVFV